MPLHDLSTCDCGPKRRLIDHIGNPYYPQVMQKRSQGIVIDGVPKLLAGGNDYLDLATDIRVRQAAHHAIDRFGVCVPSASGRPNPGAHGAEAAVLRRAAHEAVDRYGVGMTGSPLLNGYLDIQCRLEHEIAAWIGKDAALVFTADALAVTGPLAQVIMMNRGTTVVSDSAIGGLLRDGIRLAHARHVAEFTHNDLADLRRVLAEASGQGSQPLLVLESGTDSEEPLLLAEITETAQEFGASIFLHETSLSPHGAVGGLAAQLGLTDRMDVITGSLGTSFGAGGAFLAASWDLVKHFEAFCSTRMFAASPPPLITAAALAALRSRPLYLVPDDGPAAPTGTGDWNAYEELRSALAADLAAWGGKAAGMVFSSGALANIYGLSEIIAMNPDMTVLTDRANHASLVDAIRLGRPRRTAKFAHNDVADLELKLQQAARQSDRLLVVVEGAHGVEADLAPLREIVAAAEAVGAEIYVDDAHGMGVIGGGRGTAAHFDIADRVDYIAGTFSKSFGASGGYLLASEAVIDRLAAARPSDDPSTALAPAVVAAVRCALSIMAAEPDRGAAALAGAGRLRERLRALGIDAVGTTPVVTVSLKNLLRSAQSPEVLAITHQNPRRQAIEQVRASVLRDSVGTIKAQHWLLTERHIYTNAFIAPGVDEPVLRLSVTAGTGAEEIDRIVDAFADLRGICHGLVQADHAMVA
ncbi:aminotransferase class I/II-fold pyridoxal phosphate-dependent enzyme [Kitasatospora mediocidica]|uniref:aminotransferase class I/II-fold pyridoxal phosphate-dependent enzyme n=1 Tax=Kitasatospora mediocidica TaxID=58352 RepID=UPI00068D34E0|nr:aminotransferase class I/II-fold pyridoxal phosphate-dependent enzyme [Kitasatospora mediocidica]